MFLQILFYFWVFLGSFLLVTPLSSAQFQTSPPEKSSGEQDKSEAAAFILALDAGHGGRDGGSKGPGKFLEKDLTLRAVKLLAERLKRYPEIKIVFTRNSDEEVTAVRRAAVANFNGAALMVSIHADGSWRPTSRGPSILVASPQRPPRVEGEAPQAVALRWQRGQNVYLADSRRFAKGVQNRFGEIQKGQKPQIRTLTLLALEGARMPAVYINLGVISTPEEAARLRELKRDDPYLKAIESEILRFAGIAEKPPEENPNEETSNQDGTTSNPTINEKASGED